METTGISNPNVQPEVQALEQKQTAVQDTKRVDERRVAEANNSPETTVSEKDIAEIEKSTDSLNRLMEVYGLGVSFDKDSDTNRQVLKVYDRETQEVIKQYPSDSALATIKHLNEYLESRNGAIKQELTGALFDEKI